MSSFACELPFPLASDPETGQLSSEGQPMIVIPRRFFVYIQMAVEEQLGTAAAEKLYDEPTRKGARVWCEMHEKESGQAPMAVVRDYLDRVSRRGMGRLEISSIDEASCDGEFTVANSIFVAELGRANDRKVCYSFAAAFGGAMEYLRERRGLVAVAAESRERTCEAQGAHACRFQVTFPRSSQ